MFVILRQDVDKVGKAGEVIKVKDGFGRNYLIPRNFAFPATDAHMNRYKESTKSKGYKEAQLKKSDVYLQKALSDKTVVIKMKVGEEDKLFGSVTSQNIADELKAMGIEIDKRRIQLEENIKHLGEFKVAYKAHSETEISISVSVVAEA